MAEKPNELAHGWTTGPALTGKNSKTFTGGYRGTTSKATPAVRPAPPKPPAGKGGGS